MEVMIISSRALALCPTNNWTAGHWNPDGTCRHATDDDGGIPNWEDRETLATEQRIANEAPGRRASASETKLEAYRRIVATTSYGTVEHHGHLFTVDLFSASAVVQLHDALTTPAAKEKLLSLRPDSAASIAFKLASK